MRRRQVYLVKAFCWSVIVCLSAASSLGREWTDASGRHSWKAEILAANEQVIVLQERKGDLHAVQVSELSAADQQFVADYLSEPDSKVNRNMHSWTMQSGLKVKAEVLGYKSGPVEISYRNGTPYVNRKRFARIDQVYQTMLPKLVAATDDSSVQSVDDFKAWAKKLRREKRTIQVDGVLMQLESGDEYAVPLFLFSEPDRRALENGWEQWSADESTREQKEREDLLLRAEADEYQRSRQQEDNKRNQIQMMQLGLLAVDAGLTSIWEVTLMPGRSMNGRPQRVVVPANDSRAAIQTALSKYPGYVAGPARQLSRR